MAGNRNPHQTFLPPGTLFRNDGLDNGGPEYGVVVHCWFDEDFDFYDCYIAFFGDQQPSGKPTDRPYILRYASTSLVVLDRGSPD
jgi:hypothetical protein